MLIDAGLKPETKQTSLFLPWSKMPEGLLYVTVAGKRTSTFIVLN